MDQNEKTAKLIEAVDALNPAVTAKAVVDVLLDEDEDVGDIAADFIENEVGRFDAQNNWEVFKQKHDAVRKVEEYLNRYSLLSNPQEIVNYLDQMFARNPGRWK